MTVPFKRSTPTSFAVDCSFEKVVWWGGDYRDSVTEADSLECCGRRLQPIMTYNFDPDRWYEAQLRLLDHRLHLGELDDAQYQSEVDTLERRYDEMLRRLDGTYALPDRRPGAD